MPTHKLEALPTAEDIEHYRDEAASAADTVTISYPNAKDRSLVVSPRGTCVIMGDNVTRTALSPNTSAQEVVDALEA